MSPSNKFNYKILTQGLQIFNFDKGMLMYCGTVIGTNEYTVIMITYFLSNLIVCILQLKFVLSHAILRLLITFMYLQKNANAFVPRIHSGS